MNNTFAREMTAVDDHYLRAKELEIEASINNFCDYDETCSESQISNVSGPKCDFEDEKERQNRKYSGNLSSKMKDKFQMKEDEYFTAKETRNS